MSYKIEVFSEEPIIVAHLYDDFSIAQEMLSSIDDARLAFDSSEWPVFYILNLAEVKFDVNDVIAGANQSSRGDDPLWHHPNIREFIMVSQSKLVQLAASGLSSVSFGSLNVKVFGDLEQALAYCREQIRAR